MPRASEPITESSVFNRKSRKFIFPVLWLALVVWFVRTAFYNSRPADPDNSANSTEAIPFLSGGTDFFGIASPVTEKPQSASANISTSGKVAVIIETRRSGNIVPLILHFSAVLGPTWPLVIYTAAENFGSFSTSASLLRHQRSGRIIVRSLAEGVYFSNWDSVSRFLTSPWLWDDLAPAENILLFQSDSILCANAVRSVDDFFEYDLIGAPIEPRWGVGYNGGLSLRRRSTILRVLDEWKWENNPQPHPEDQWFYAR